MARIVVVDPDTLTAALLAGRLQKAGHSTTHCATAEQAFAACTDAPPDCLVLELLLPDYNGVALLQLMQSYPALAAIKSMVVTTIPNADVGLSSRAWREYGVVDYVSKLHMRPSAIARRIIRIIS